LPLQGLAIGNAEALCERLSSDRRSSRVSFSSARIRASRFIGQRYRVGTRLLVICELSKHRGFAPNILPTKSSGCYCAKKRRERTKGWSAMRGRVEVGPPGHRNSRLVVSLSPTIKSRSRTWRLWCGADSSHDKPSGQAIVCRMRVPASLKVAPHEQGHFVRYRSGSLLLMP